MLRIWLGFMFLLPSMAVWSQTELQFGPLSAGYANVSSITDNPFAVFSNPAAAPLKTRQLGLWVNNRFGIQDFSVVGITYQAKGLGLGFRTSGNQFLAEYNPTVAYTLNATSRLKLGAGLSGFIIRVQSESMADNRTLLTGNLGLLFQYNERLSFGGTARNFIQSDTQRAVKKQEYLGFALNYVPDSILSFHTEVFTAFTNSLAFRFAVNYQVSPQVGIRYGLVNKPFSNHLGIDLLLGKVRVFVAASYQNTLGFSPDIGAAYPIPRTHKNE